MFWSLHFYYVNGKCSMNLDAEVGLPIMLLSTSKQHKWAISIFPWMALFMVYLTTLSVAQTM